MSWFRWRLPLLVCLLLACPMAAAEQAGHDVLAQAVKSFLSEQTAPLGKRVEIEVGRLPENSHIASCTHWNVFLPSGTRAWGNTTVGVRCEAGAKASLFINSKVRVFGQYVVTARPVQAGAQLEAADLQLDEGELSAQSPDALTSLEAALGLRIRTGLQARQVVRTSNLRLPVFVNGGQSVKVIARGKGFDVSYEGQAINTALQGQVVRVRLPSGKIVSGITRAEGVVEVSAP